MLIFFIIYYFKIRKDAIKFIKFVNIFSSWHISTSCFSLDFCSRRKSTWGTRFFRVGWNEGESFEFRPRKKERKKEKKWGKKLTNTCKNPVKKWFPFSLMISLCKWQQFLRNLTLGSIFLGALISPNPRLPSFRKNCAPIFPNSFFAWAPISPNSIIRRASIFSDISCFLQTAFFDL